MCFEPYKVCKNAEFKKYFVKLVSFISSMGIFDMLQYSSQVMLRVYALRGMRAREKLARVQGCFEEL